jgi:hypothetical protein
MIGAKTQGATVSLCHMSKLEEDISPTGQSITPNGGKTLYIGNQEMSDKSRNGLQKKMPEAGRRSPL